MQTKPSLAANLQGFIHFLPLTRWHRAKLSKFILICKCCECALCYLELKHGEAKSEQDIFIEREKERVWESNIDGKKTVYYAMQC